MTGERRRGDRPSKAVDELPDEVDARLDHEDDEVRASAVWSVAELAADDPGTASQFVERLVDRIDDPDSWARRGATWALGEIADARPDEVRYEADALIDALDDPDPLVRENAIVGIENLSSEHPRIAASALDALVEIARNADESRIRRYAREAIDRIVDALETEASDGMPLTVELPPEHADLFPSASVIESTDDREDSIGVEVDPERDRRRSDETDTGGRSRRAPIGGSAPPEELPPPPDVRVSPEDVDLGDTVRSGPLMTVHRSRARTANTVGAIPVELRVFATEDLDPDRELVESTMGAIDDWRRIDRHDAVLTTLGYGANSIPWVATEVADGRRFEEYAVASDFEEALYYASRLVRAVCHAHGNDVIHGGLSPRAVGFVEPIEDAWHVPKIADWGFGTVIRDRLDRSPVPPAYAAPEQLAPGTFGSPDQSTDVYGLGVLLYTLFAGRPPLDDGSPTVVRYLRAREGEGSPGSLPRPDPPSERVDDVPSAADRLLDRALSFDRMGRYETVHDLRRDLESLVEAHADWR